MDDVIDQSIKTVNISPAKWVQKSKPTVFGTLLPYLIIAALVVSNLFFAVQICGAWSELFSGPMPWDMIFLLALASGIAEYLIFLLIMFIYRKILERVPYYFLVPQHTFIMHFKFWYLVRTVIMCGFNLLLFAAPYLNVFSPIVSLILSYLVVVLSYVSLTKYIDIMFRHMYFKLLITPWFVFQVIWLLVWGL